ncbi:flavin-containing monooxygenase [Nocardioides mangrovi]|uniref:NAD(P)/FAD-dependent oxidoreductase n=1 Tax=Nocardioides mangrovi TaxID=2874580 RepID=A0ABS7UAR7_9ACTN|nr:NAD(P)/FAD-dependent oxidoreductase [Nocardioides mangrovi]MBZ5738061.1 NAD(P)/FAD-dependent oxidoreductase [Nocardioides mangrovi]
MTEHVDVLVVGAGLSGIGAACRLRTEHPGRSLAILEARDAIGGTWDLFRYPGIRSDSDMFTLGYAWRPWADERALADGASIRGYVQDTAREYGVDRLVRFGHRMLAADWDSSTALWTVTVEHDGETSQLTTGFLYGCTGYYDYDQGHTPVFPGRDDFRGTVIHPQHWPEDLDYTGKKVVVIGSGATAVTLVPAMADRGAGHVTMLQRSPSYVLSLPGADPVAHALRWLPQRLRFPLVRWKSILTFRFFYQRSRRRPDQIRGWLRKQMLPQLPEGYDVDRHFKPTYDPWTQRMCFVPDGDLFKAISRGDASVVTDQIDTFTETGIRLASGEELDADIIVTATGLKLQLFGGATLTVDGEPVKPHETLAYRALMLSDVPNLAFTIGYTNASWTLKADLVADFVCRLLTRMDEAGARIVVAPRDPSVGEERLMDFESGYILRALDELPVQGDREPWKLRQDYLADRRTLGRKPVDDGVLQFT